MKDKDKMKTFVCNEILDEKSLQIKKNHEEDHAQDVMTHIELQKYLQRQLRAIV